MFPPVSALHHNRESVDYIADTTLRFFPIRVTLFASGSTHLVLVVITAVNLRHVTVPVNPCAVLSLNTSLMS